MPDPFVEITDLKLVDGNHVRLQCGELTIRERITTVLGASGAGKTSLLNLIAGFESPSNGRLVTSKVFWVPQDGGLWPHLTVRKHLQLMQPGNHEELLSQFGLQALADAFPDQLSRGEQSRLSLARALLSNAPLLVMDEPLSHLDPAQAPAFWEAFMQAVHKQEQALLFATHEPERALCYADEVIGIKDGRVIYQGKPDTLYHQPPDQDSAELLGKTNWMLPKKVQFLFGIEETEPRSVRPEEILLEPSDTSDLEVQKEAFHGHYSDFTIASKTREEAYVVRALPCRQRLASGTSVLLKMLTFICFACLFTSCGEVSDNTLPLGNVTTWKVPPFGSRLPAARSIAAGNDDEIVVLDNAGRVLVYNPSGQLDRQWTMPEFDVGRPEGVVVLQDGRIIVCDTHYHRVVCFSSTGDVINMFGSKGEKDGQFIYPVAITTDPEENLFICEYGSNDRVQKFRPDGSFLNRFGSFGTDPGQFQRPSGIVWHDQVLYVADAINNRVQAFTEDGEFIRILTNQDGNALDLHFPYDMVMDREETLYLVEYGSGRISRLKTDGTLLGRWGSNGSGLDQLSTPWGITIDSQNRIRIADTGNRRIVALEPLDL